MTGPTKTLEALRKPVTGNGPERDTVEAYNRALPVPPEFDRTTVSEFGGE